MTDYLERTTLLIGDAAQNKLASSFVAVVGLGGVGGHCADALARAGVGRLHIVDADIVQQSNLNRQLIATKSTVGHKKTDAMEARIHEVSDCAVTKSDLFVTPENVDKALVDGLDFIVDAIDSMAGKLALIGYAAGHGIPIVSCMGAGNRLDPARFSVKDVYSTSGDPLARKLRQNLRKMEIASLPVVCSDEAPHVAPSQRVIGSIAPVTGTAGMTAAGYVLRCLIAGYLE